MISILGLLGYLALAIWMFLLGNLSARLGRVTNARPYFWGLYVAAILMIFSVFARLYFITRLSDSLEAQNQFLLYTLLTNGVAALSVTLALVVAWFYWSWLFAERE